MQERTLVFRIVVTLALLAAWSQAEAAFSCGYFLNDIHCNTGQSGGTTREYIEHWIAELDIEECKDKFVPKACRGVAAVGGVGSTRYPLGFDYGTNRHWRRAGNRYPGSTTNPEPPMTSETYSAEVMQDIRNCCQTDRDCGNFKPNFGPDQMPGTPDDEECEPPSGPFNQLTQCDENCKLRTEEAARCGNGVTDRREQCDDGNTTSGDGCSLNCMIEICGNGVLDAGEQCDDGNSVSGDGCSSTCQLEPNPNCPDGNLDTYAPSEECDDANLIDGDGCSAKCTMEFCSDGTVDVSSGEECDDGNLLDLDGCDSSCQFERTGACGDGVLDRFLLEECDDGNTIDGDGCNANCLIEICGNFRIEAPTEACDDGNTTGGDGCDALCQLEAGASCGDGTLDLSPASEQCDDGNGSDGDGCSAYCRIEKCGDGILNVGEQCDDRNNIFGDGCDPFCQLEFCGDGYVQRRTELCDDGNTTSGDGCDATCLPEPSTGCGDGVLDPDGVDNVVGTLDDEACDDGCDRGLAGVCEPIDDIDGCTRYCKLRSGGCGNRILEQGEQCDDGNLLFGDGCSAACGIEGCGDSMVQPVLGEQCDDGNYLNGDGCDICCQAEPPLPPPACGNGIIDQAFEECEPPLVDSCNAGCIYVHPTPPPNCGNGVLDLPEQCDDGNTVPGDGCNARCLAESCGDGYLDPDGPDNVQANSDDEDCEPPSTPTCNAFCKTTTTCGDGVAQAGEGCDDGNNVSNDGCAAGCQPEFCGDGIVQSPLGEACDDGNVAPGDGCDPFCQLEMVFPICGNGIVEAGEQCDDGNLFPGDGCDPFCQLEPGTMPGCGNGILESGEQCDDGNTMAGDGCDSSCQLEPSPLCGDGLLTPPEQCDDGGVCANLVTLCTRPTSIPICGDLSCAPASGDGCSATCAVEICGNGVIDLLESCDDGNTVAGDGCGPTCVPEICGNGIFDPGEACEDGNIQAGDGCSPGCQPEVCGNFVLDALIGEQCDDGNTVSGDGCSSSCRLEPSCNDNSDCDDDNACTDDVCDAATGSCVNSDISSSCDDGIDCTIDFCDPEIGCDIEPTSDCPKTIGFYKRLCAGPHPEDELTQVDAECVNDSATFAGISSVADVCDVMHPDPPNDKCEQAESQLMALLLNACKGRVWDDMPIQSICTSNTTVGQSVAEADGLLANPARTTADCVLAQCESDEINTGSALGITTIRLGRPPTGAVRLSWNEAFLDGEFGQVLYKVWRRRDSMSGFELIGEATELFFDDMTAAPGVDYQYTLTHGPN